MHIQSLENIFLKLLRILGLCPWNILQFNIKSKRANLFILTIHLFYILISIILVKYFEDLIFNNYGDFGKYNDIFKSSTVLLSFLLVVLETYLRAEKHHELHKQFTIAEELINEHFSNEELNL